MLQVITNGQKARQRIRHKDFFKGAEHPYLKIRGQCGSSDLLEKHTLFICQKSLLGSGAQCRLESIEQTRARFVFRVTTRTTKTMVTATFDLTMTNINLFVWGYNAFIKIQEVTT